MPDRTHMALGACCHLWVVGICVSLLFTGCGCGGEQWPSLVEGGGCRLLLLSPIVGVLCVVCRHSVGRSSSVVSVHGISMLSSHHRCLVRLSHFVVDPLLCFSPLCWSSIVDLCWSDDNKQKICCWSFSYNVTVNNVAPALCVINIRGEVLRAYLGWCSCW